jgi:putative transposase
MSSLLQPLHLLLMMFAGWVNRHQLDVIDYLQEENRVLKERLGGRRIRFTGAERQRLARKAHALGRKVLKELETLVTPDTLLRWHRELVASKGNYSQRRGPGRPRIMKTIVDLILRMALENRSWGYTRIRGALANLGHQVGRGTIANILREHSIEPAPARDRHTRWSTFLKAHWECLTELLKSSGGLGERNRVQAVLGPNRGSRPRAFAARGRGQAGEWQRSRFRHRPVASYESEVPRLANTGSGPTTLDEESH